MAGYQVGDESQVNPGASTVPGWYSFENNGTLQNNNNVQATDVSLAFNQCLDVPAGKTRNIYMYVTICSDLNSARTSADLVRQQNGNQWFCQTATEYTNWLNNGGKGKRSNTGDAGIDTFFDHALIMIKNLQNPGLGTISATTNPVAYQYKNWVRDASVTAIALDATGHYTEAEQYWRWMASKQLSDGTWKTTFQFWDGSYLQFVEPEYDSVGAFLYGVYRHYLVTGDTAFISDLWSVIQKGVNWILNNISSANGLGAADCSIWEESPPEYNTYTQAWYIAGFYAAQWIAEIIGDTALTDWYAGGPASILTALQRPDSWAMPGMWNSAGNFYNRAVNANNSPRRLVDSSSDLLIALGLIDHTSSRASNHIATVKNQLTHLGFGIARYQGDEFYDTEPNSPASNEAGGPEPSWPQMSMWIAIYEILCGNLPLALQYMQWHVSTSGKGFMPHGEAVNNNTSQPVLSSMSEPLTASSFILASLLFTNQFDPRIVPPTYNAGTYKTLTINQGAPQGDWGQWSNIPYFTAPRKTRIGSSMTTAKRVYITNDDTNIYVRVDNLSGTFTAFNTNPLFALRIYSADFANGMVETASLGLDLSPLNRAMSYMVERHSNQIVYQIWSVMGGIWSPSHPINSVIAPQWDPNTGRIEAVIPISVFASANPTLGSAWANMIIALAAYDQVNNIWNDDSKTLIHYRLTTSSQNWIYGNIE